jgi:hypothetical protein
MQRNPPQRNSRAGTLRQTGVSGIPIAKSVVPRAGAEMQHDNRVQPRLWVRSDQTDRSATVMLHPGSIVTNGHVHNPAYHDSAWLWKDLRSHRPHYPPNSWCQMHGIKLAMPAAACDPAVPRHVHCPQSPLRDSLSSHSFPPRTSHTTMNVIRLYSLTAQP